MKLIRKLMTFALAVLMGFVVSGIVPVSAAAGTITVTPPAGTTDSSTTTYQLYKVFVATGDGTGIRYNTVNTNDEISDSGGNVLLHSKGWKVPDVSSYVTGYSDTATNHFIVDSSGNVHWGTLKQGATGSYVSGPYTHSEQLAYNEDDIIDAQTTAGQTLTLPDYAISAIRDYIKDDSPIQTVSTTGTKAAVFTNVDNGYYYVTTSTGTAVSVTSSNPNASVTDKNDVPTLTKVITGVNKTGKTTVTVGSVTTAGNQAIAELGSTVTYQITVKFSHGFESVVLHDALDENELRLVDADPTIKYYDNNSNELSNVGAAVIRRNQDGTTGTEDDPSAGDTLTIDFSNITSGTVDHAVISYSAVVESGTLSSASGQNAAYLSYGTNAPNQAATDKVRTEVKNAKYTVTKVDNAGQPLAGAGFILSKSETNGSTTTRYYYKNDGTNVSWVTVTPADGQTEENALRAAVEAGNITQYTTTSGENGNVIDFTGLADGTYSLMELTVPTGYMRTETEDITIHSATAENAFEASNLEKTATVTNRAGKELPSTGGSGTLIFYLIGGAIVAAAVLLLKKVRAR